jgi:hypothetical protein
MVVKEKVVVYIPDNSNCTVLTEVLGLAVRRLFVRELGLNRKTATSYPDRMSFLSHKNSMP